MFTNSKLAKSVKLAFAFSAASAFSFSGAVQAQDEQSAETVEKIQVTGSRIQRTDIESPVPITVIGRNEILSIGAINAADVLNQSPVSIASSDQSNSSFSTTAVGLNTTALRNLGESRTLVLVNGRRFVSGVSPSSGYAVDLNSIPASMIERIEILKSASSAIYGSDAVAGVVNIITRSDFEGVEVNVTSGISGESDREKNAINITAGNSWDSGSVTIAMGYDDDKGLKASDRDFSRYDQAVFLDENGDEYVDIQNSSYPPQGRVGSYNADGTPYVGSENSFNRASFRQLVTPLERKYVAFNFTQELNDDVQYFAEANWNSSETYDSTIEPTPFNVEDVFKPSRGGTGGISMSNPMLPDLLVQNLMNDGLTMDDNIPWTVRRMVEFGARSTNMERDTVRIATGLDWNIDDNWALNTFVSWGKTDQWQENGGQVNLERAYQAFNVVEDPDTGEIVCADETARLYGCVPLNIWGEGTVSEEAVRYVSTPAKATGEAEQFIFGATVVGETPLELPGGFVNVAVGVEHRLEKGQFQPGDFAQVGASSTNQADATDGSFYTNDVFVETSIPVLDNLILDAAARYADHEITGGDTTWNLGVEYSPIETLKLRASAATAIRTPNIADLFGGRGETFAGVSDPCSGITADSTGTVAENCLSIPEISARVARDGEFVLTQVESQSTGGTVGGNPDVNPETSDNWSAGAVWQVMDGLSLTVDYYDISIEDAISTTSRSTVVRRCFESTNFDPNCGGDVVRDANGALAEVHSGTSNENDIDTKGFDVEVAYTTELVGGQFGVNFIWNHTSEYVVTGIESGDAVDFAGEVLNPDDRANLNLSYGYEDWNFTWRMRYWASSVDSVEGNNYNFTNFAPLEEYNEFPSVIYHDVSASYAISDDMNISLVVRNAFDKQPPVANQSSVNGGTGINTVSEAYDVTGRYMQASFTARF